MLVRLLNPSDAESHHALRLRGLKENPEAFGSSYEEEVDFPLEKIRSRIPESGDNFVLGAFDDKNQLAGIATFRRETHLKSLHKGNVYGMYVAPESRGKGFGKALLTDLIQRVQAVQGVERINLDVVTTMEPARNLYLSHGFAIYGLEKSALKHQGKYYDVEYLVLPLTR
jgi:ribosomal protein S18 acetylase RimI-like enzyme